MSSPKFNNIYVIDPGNNVICDYCNEDFTDSPLEGGILFQSKAICPRCSPEAEKSIARYGEERFIRGRCPKGMSFADWVRDKVRMGKP